MKAFNLHFILHALGLCLVIGGIIILSLVFLKICFAFLYILPLFSNWYLIKLFTTFIVFLIGVTMFILGFYMMYRARKVFSKEERI